MDKIDSVLRETRIFEPPRSFATATVAGRAAYDRLVTEAQDDWEGFWRRRAEECITWMREPTVVYEAGENEGEHRHSWFRDGTLNISANCIDRHLPERAEQTAIIFEADDGAVEHWSYQRLHDEVCRFANGLLSLGVGAGDRVVLYMPMRPEAVVCMLACTRIGAIHSVVFAGFSAKSLRDRITQVSASVVVTADEGVRGGRRIPLKQTVDEAVAGVGGVRTVIVLRRTGAAVGMTPQRDRWWDDVTAGQAATCEPREMSAEDTLFVLYTSGSTGKPKGIQHTIGGYLLGAMLSMKWVFDIQPNDIYWCTADVGWITGHTYVAYGPTAMGATQLIFEGTPTHPHPGRFWEIVQTHRVTTFYTAPTAIRALMKSGPRLPQEYDLSSLRLLGTVGESINPEAWMWYREQVGGTRCPIVDTWWQTETGANMIAPLPGAIATKPGSCTLPLPGIFASVVNEAGQELNANEGGFLVITKPWPWQMRTVFGDHARYCATYYPPDIAGGRHYLAGDSAHTDEDGYFWIMGRIDDVLNISAHRLGTMEVESALVAHPRVAEVAVVGRPDEVTGEAIVAFVVLNEERPHDEQQRQKMIAELREWTAQEIGAIAKPKEIRFGDNLPKTRSGKIMRRLLRAIARGDEITQDVSTLENPAILEQLRKNG